VKSFKGLVVKAAVDQYARRVLFAFFDCIDDTMLLNKTITKEIADNIAGTFEFTELNYFIDFRSGIRQVGC
jgi:hypothetical protein